MGAGVDMHVGGYVCMCVWGGGVGVCVSGTVCSRVEVLVKSGTIHLNCRHKSI